MPTPGETLGALDFEQLIGGPLRAAVHAEAEAAMTTVDFVRAVGFDPNGDVSTMTFAYKKLVTDASSGAPREKTVTVTVPTLALVRPPVLRVESVDIEFLAKINTVEYREKSSAFDISGTLEFGAKWGWGHASLKVTAAYQSKNREGNTRTEDYSMSVKVHAGQADMPAGMAKVFALLEGAIAEKPE